MKYCWKWRKTPWPKPSNFTVNYTYRFRFKQVVLQSLYCHQRLQLLHCKWEFINILNAYFAAIFLSFTLILSGGSTLIQVLVLNVYFRGQQEMSPFVKYYILKPLSVILFVPIQGLKNYLFKSKPVCIINSEIRGFGSRCFTESRSGEVYLIQKYVIKFASDVWEVGGFLRVLRFPTPIKLTATI
jgi:hypothetical protein